MNSSHAREVGQVGRDFLISPGQTKVFFPCFKMRAPLNNRAQVGQESAGWASGSWQVSRKFRRLSCCYSFPCFPLFSSPPASTSQSWLTSRCGRKKAVKSRITSTPRACYCASQGPFVRRVWCSFEAAKDESLLWLDGASLFKGRCRSNSAVLASELGVGHPPLTPSVPLRDGAR